MQKICCINWGDGIGVTELQATTITSISNKFQNNKNITTLIDLKLLTNLTKIDTDRAFCGCTSLVNVEGFDNITSFASNIFLGLSSIKSINITSKCDTLGAAMCYSASNLETIGDISNVNKIPERCFGSTCLSGSINISNKCTVIERSAFSNCKLTDIGDISSVSSIGGNAFYSNYLSKLIIPDVCINIGNSAFYSCSKLTYIKCLSTTPPTIGTNAFYGSTCNIYVPDDSLSVYQSATNWSDYSTRIKKLSDFTTDFPNEQ